MTYYDLKPKTTPIHIGSKRTPIIVLYIYIDLTKARHMNFRNPLQSYLPSLLPIHGRWLKGRLKSIYYRNPYLTLNTMRTFLPLC